MDKRLQDIVNNFERMKIGLDDTFKFECKMCGKCCIHREDIMLNPKDIYNMAKELNLKTGELVEKYCEAYIGPDSRIPIVRLKPRGSVHRCPLLKDRKCMVHQSKPTVCAMYPIGRCLVLAGKTAADIDLDSVQYIFNKPDCKGSEGTETHTVREWLEAFDIPIEDEYFLMWQKKIVMDMSCVFREIEKKVSDKTMEMLWNAAFVGLYLHYKTELDFMSQFEENVQNFNSLLHSAFGDMLEGRE